MKSRTPERIESIKNAGLVDVRSEHVLVENRDDLSAGGCDGDFFDECLQPEQVARHFDDDHVRLATARSFDATAIVGDVVRDGPHVRDQRDRRLHLMVEGGIGSHDENAWCFIHGALVKPS
jgi:hypothetical protein